MRNKVIKLFGMIAFILLAGGLFSAKPCYAASANIEITSDVQEVTVGDNIIVSITISSETKFKEFEANLTYDDEMFEYNGTSTAINGDGGFLKISDMHVSEGVTKRKYSLKFKALKVGYSNISLRDRAMVYDESGDEMSVSSNVLSIKTTAMVTASDNAYLKSLKVKPSDITPDFDKNVFEYDMNVNSDTEKLVINAIPEDDKSTVSITGNDSLKEGENKINVTVLAESGAVIEYSINVTRESAPNNSDDDTTISPEDIKGTLEVVTKDNNNFIIYSGKYQLVEPGSEVVIPAGYFKTQMRISNISINAYSPENDLESEFLLIYAKNELGEEGFYQYDRIEKTLQRYVAKKVVTDNNSVVEDDTKNDQSNENRSNLNKAAIIIAIISVICAILTVVIIIQFMKLKGYKK